MNKPIIPVKKSKKIRKKVKIRIPVPLKPHKAIPPDKIYNRKKEKEKLHWLRFQTISDEF